MFGRPGQAGDHASLVFESSRPAEEKPLFFARLRSFAGERNWSSAIANEVQLILEEWLTNVIAYGIAHHERPYLRLEIAADGPDARIRVTDNGVPFDPTRHPEPDFSLPPEERPVGGLGIYMIKKLSSRFTYERHAEWNVVSIEKNLESPVLGKIQGET